MDESVPEKHKFKNSSALETGLFPLHQLTNSHFHSIIPLKLVTCQVLLQWPKQISPIAALITCILHALC
jgi:hypothetical protein